MARVFVTGATGLLGRGLARELLSAGHTVVAWRRATSNTKPLAGLPIQWEVGDLLDVNALERAMAGCEAVFHVAALVSYDRRRERELEVTNVQGTRAVLEAARRARVRRVVHTSSIAACAHTRDARVLDESTPWNSSALRVGYLTTKHRAELEVARAVANGLDAVMVNPSVVLGPSPGGNLDSMKNDLAAGRIVAVPGGGCGFVSLEDTVRGHLLAWERGRRGEKYVISSENLTWAEFLRRMGSCVGTSWRGRVLPGGLVRALSWTLDGAALCGFEPRMVTGPGLRALSVYLWFDGKKAERELGLRCAPIEDALGRVACAQV